MRASQRVELVLEPIGDDLEAEVQEVPERLCRSSRSGRPTSAFSVGMRHVRLTMKLVWSGVFLKRYAITIFGSASFLISSAIRTSSVETSLHVEQRRQLARQHDVGDAFDERVPCSPRRECW